MADIDRTTAIEALEALEQELVVALTEYDFHGTPGFYEDAHHAVCCYVDAMRARSCTPEDVVITVKRIARIAGFGSQASVGRRGITDESDLRLEGLVSCAIRRFFRLSPTTMDVRPVWTPVRVVC